MKSIDVKSLLIGFLLCATFFLSVGAKPSYDIDSSWHPAVASDGPVGTYQITSNTRDGAYLINTRNGALYWLVKGQTEKHWRFLTATFKD